MGSKTCDEGMTGDPGAACEVASFIMRTRAEDMLGRREVKRSTMSTLE